MPDPNLNKIIPPKGLTAEQRQNLFQHFFRKLAVHRNDRALYARAELAKGELTEGFEEELDKWANALAQNVWDACQLEGDCPELDPFAETATRDLTPLPSLSHIQQVINTTLFLHLTTCKSYSAQTRTFLFQFSRDSDPRLKPAEHTIVSPLKNPERALEEVEKAAKQTQAQGNKMLRRFGIGIGAVAGGVLIGVTGGLAAPFLGAGIGSVLGVLGVGGTSAAILATGLASSSVVCGALFGAYGANRTARMVARYTADVKDFEFRRVGRERETESLGVVLCVSGWLNDAGDVTGPWTVLDVGPESDEVFALQWEVKALEALSTAFTDLIRENAFRYLRFDIVKRTLLAGFLAGLSPLLILEIGQIIDNPWMKAKALAAKTGKVLATLFSERAFGARPVTLTGYSLGSLVIYNALQHLSRLPASQTMHLISDVYIFGLPSAIDLKAWASIRRLVSGRLVNGYSEGDWVLGILGRATSDTALKGGFEIAGLKPVQVRGVENLQWDVGGHLGWRGSVGACLEHLGIEVDRQGVERKQREDVERIQEIHDSNVDDIVFDAEKGKAL